MRLALRLGSTCVVVVVMALAWAGVACASGLPVIESAHMVEIEEWVYHEAAIKDPEPCGETCQSLVNEMHKTMPETAATQAFWDAIGSLFTEKTHLWGTLVEFRNALNGAFPMGLSPFRIGWHIGSGEGSKWMEVLTPLAPLQTFGCGWQGIFKVSGDEIGSSSVDHPHAPGNEWYLLGCNGSEIVGEYAYAENPSQPEQNCNKNSYELTISGWSKQEWIWNQCVEGFNAGKEVLAPIYAEGFYRPFHYGRVEPWTGQTLTGEMQRNIQTLGPTDSGATVVREAIEKALEESKPFQAWTQWELEGEKGIDPLAASPWEQYGAGNPSAPEEGKCLTGHPVNCATGDQVERQTDLSVGGRGPGLRLTRTYNSQLAVQQTSPGRVRVRVERSL